MEGNAEKQDEPKLPPELEAIQDRLLLKAEKNNFVMDEAAAARFDKTALVQSTKSQEELFEELKKLNFSNPDQFTPALMRAYKELGAYLTVEITARTLMVKNFNSVEQVERAQKLLMQMGADDSSEKQLRVEALQAVTATGKVLMDMSQGIIKIAEATTKDGRRPISGEDSNGQQFPQLPPPMPPSITQININSGQPGQEKLEVISGKKMQSPAKSGDPKPVDV